MDENAIKTYQGEKAEELPEVEEAINNPPVPTEEQPAEHWNESGNMMTVDSLPADVRDTMPEDAQMVFVAAYNSIMEQGGDRESAMQVAWQTIEHNELYTRDANGKWVHTPVEQGLHNPQPLSAS